MKQKVSDYIADRLAQEGIRQVFTVTGGGAMHLNDSLGHHPGLSCLYHHHEQAAAMAASSWANCPLTRNTRFAPFISSSQ